MALKCFFSCIAWFCPLHQDTLFQAWIKKALLTAKYSALMRPCGKPNSTQSTKSRGNYQHRRIQTTHCEKENSPPAKEKIHSDQRQEKLVPMSEDWTCFGHRKSQAKIVWQIFHANYQSESMIQWSPTWPWVWVWNLIWLWATHSHPRFWGRAQAMPETRLAQGASKNFPGVNFQHN